MAYCICTYTVLKIWHFCITLTQKYGIFELHCPKYMVFLYTVPKIWHVQYILFTLSPKVILISAYKTESVTIGADATILVLRTSSFWVRKCKQRTDIIFIHSYFTFNVLLLLFCLFLCFPAKWYFTCGFLFFIFNILMFSLIFCLFFFRSFIC